MMDIGGFIVEYLPWLTAAVGIALLILIPKKIIALFAFLIVMALAVVSYHYVEKARYEREAALVTISVAHDVKTCGEGTPLSVLVVNGSSQTATGVSWNIAAHMQGDTGNLVWYGRTGKEWDQPYSADRAVGPGESVQRCFAVPTLKSGLYPHTLEYKAIYKTVVFGR